MLQACQGPVRAIPHQAGCTTPDRIKITTKLTARLPVIALLQANLSGAQRLQSSSPLAVMCLCGPQAASATPAKQQHAEVGGVPDGYSSGLVTDLVTEAT